jgi:hypothetical protein
VIEARTNASFEANLIGAPTGLIGALGLAIADPSTQTTVSPRDTAGIVEYPPDSGVYTATRTAPPEPGGYLLVWDFEGTEAIEDLHVTGATAGDIRTLIPQTRRAIDGPTAVEATSPSATLTDDQLNGLIADAIAEVIFHTGGLFGHELLVTDRDDIYRAPSEWALDPELAEPEKTVIVAQAALNHFFSVVRDIKVAETIRDEGAEWSYQLSAQLLIERVRYLTKLRDEALSVLAATYPVPTVWVSLLHERELAVARAVEPYFEGVLMP